MGYFPDYFGSWSYLPNFFGLFSHHSFGWYNFVAQLCKWSGCLPLGLTISFYVRINPFLLLILLKNLLSNTWFLFLFIWTHCLVIFWRLSSCHRSDYFLLGYTRSIYRDFLDVTQIIWLCRYCAKWLLNVSLANFHWCETFLFLDWGQGFHTLISLNRKLGHFSL